jgi:hypothetical protein
MCKFYSGRCEGEEYFSGGEKKILRVIQGADILMNHCRARSLEFRREENGKNWISLEGFFDAQIPKHLCTGICAL